ncbi:hypothetical protein [Pseudomonas nitroreducens]|uniref:hypothetical protein n=1 Tax=Pseudomonas nitroreducens TaxID=46680 RepID=UPI003CC82DC6
MKRPPIQRKVEVGGILLRVLMYFNKLWLCTEDLSRILGYRTNEGVLQAAYRHGGLLQSHSIKGQIAGEGHAVRMFDEHAVRYLCEYSKRPGAFHLMRWLEDGGMQLDQQLPLLGEQEIAPEEIELVAVDAQPKAPILALVPSQLPPVPDKHQERTKAYCRELLKTLLRYANDAEAEHLVQVVESEVGGLLDARYCQGLNDARYELYRRFWLQGGAK